MVFRLLYRLPVALVALSVRSGRSKDLEILVLRHQLALLQRTTKPPQAQRQRPVTARRHRQSAPPSPPAGPAVHTRLAAELAPPPRRPTLDPTAPTARQTINLSRSPQAGHTNGTRPEIPRGLEGVRLWWSILHGAFDGRIDIEDLVEGGDRVASRWRFSGAHIGEFNGIPATNKTFSAEFMSIDRFEGDRIAERWEVGDLLGLLQQIGVIPS